MVRKFKEFYKSHCSARDFQSVILAPHLPVEQFSQQQKCKNKTIPWLDSWSGLFYKNCMKQIWIKHKGKVFLIFSIMIGQQNGTFLIDI